MIKVSTIYQCKPPCALLHEDTAPTFLLQLQPKERKEKLKCFFPLLFNTPALHHQRFHQIHAGRDKFHSSSIAQPSPALVVKFHEERLHLSLFSFAIQFHREERSCRSDLPAMWWLVRLVTWVSHVSHASSVGSKTTSKPWIRTVPKWCIILPGSTAIFTLSNLIPLHPYYWRR